MDQFWSCIRDLGEYMLGWLKLSEVTPEPTMSRTKRIGFIFSIVSAVVFGVVNMPVAYKWSGWLLCFIGVIYMVASVPPANRLPRKTRILLGVLAVVFFIFVWKSTAVGQWKGEQSEALDGYLIPPKLSKPTLALVVQIGPAGPIYQLFTGSFSDPLFYNAGVFVEQSNKGPEITTTVRDVDGNLVVKIEKNHWRVYPPYCLDKNYTQDSLEVLDRRDYVVLQVRILPDKVQLQGEWYDDKGNGKQIMATGDPRKQSAILTTLKRGTGVSQERIAEMFMYPSKDHWGEHRDYFDALYGR